MKYLFCILVSGLSLFSVSAQDNTDSRYTIYYFLGEDCKICQYYTPQMIEYHNTYASDSVSFVGLFPNKYSSAKGVTAFAERYSIPFPLKLEYFATKTKLFEVTITPEVVVYDTEKESILYKGRIDDGYVRIGKRRRVPTKFELKDVLDNIVEGKAIANKSTPAIGCFITLRE